MPVENNFSDSPPVPVELLPLNGYMLSPDQCRQVLFGPGSKWLRLFRSVYSRKANLPLHVSAVQDGQRVTVSNSYDVSNQCRGVRLADGSEQENYDQHHFRP